MFYQVILVACLDQMIWVRISVRCAFGLTLASYLSIRRVGTRGARVVTSYAGMVPGYAGSFGYDGAPRCDSGRPQVVKALSVHREADETELDVLQYGSFSPMSLISRHLQL